MRLSSDELGAGLPLVLLTCWILCLGLELWLAQGEAGTYSSSFPSTVRRMSRSLPDIPVCCLRGLLGLLGVRLDSGEDPLYSVKHPAPLYL